MVLLQNCCQECRSSLLKLGCFYLAQPIRPLMVFSCLNTFLQSCLEFLNFLSSSPVVVIFSFLQGDEAYVLWDLITLREGTATLSYTLARSEEELRHHKKQTAIFVLDFVVLREVLSRKKKNAWDDWKHWEWTSFFKNLIIEAQNRSQENDFRKERHF